MRIKVAGRLILTFIIKNLNENSILMQVYYECESTPMIWRVGVTKGKLKADHEVKIDIYRKPKKDFRTSLR